MENGMRSVLILTIHRRMKLRLKYFGYEPECLEWSEPAEQESPLFTQANGTPITTGQIALSDRYIPSLSGFLKRPPLHRI